MQISSNLQQAKHFSMCVLEKSNANLIKSSTSKTFLHVCFGMSIAIVIKILAQNFLHFFFGEGGMCALTLNPPKTLNPWAIVFGKSYPKWTYQGKP